MAKTAAHPSKTGPLRNKFTPVVWTLTAVTFAVGLVPVIGPAISYVVDRVSNGLKANNELKSRTDWYRVQVGKTLGIDPARVTVKDFKQAAQINPMLMAAMRDVKKTENDDNNFSLMANGAATFIPGAKLAADAALGAKVLAGAKTIGTQLGVTTAGGLLLSWTGKDHINAQEVIEGMNGQLEAANEHGMDPRKVITPQMVFMLRIAQDEALAGEIKKTFHKPFQKMNDAEQQQVMLAMPALANAATTEAYAVANKMLPVQELMARAPNLNGVAAKYAMGTRNTSFAESVVASRPGAGLGSYTAAADAQRADAAHQVAGATV